MDTKSQGAKICAFCRNWYDPTNAAIKPRTPSVGLWEYDPKARNQCMMKNITTTGGQMCGKFEKKI